MNFVAFLATCRVVAAFLIGRTDNEAHSNGMQSQSLSFNVWSFSCSLLLSVVFLHAMNNQFEIELIIILACLIYCMAILSGYVSGLFERIQSSRQIFISALIRFSFFFTFVLCDVSPTYSVLLAELAAFIYLAVVIITKVKKINITITRDFIVDMSFKISNVQRVLRDNALILIISTGVLSISDQFSAKIVLSISIFNSLLTAQSILCQSSWSDFGKSKQHILNLYKSITFVMVLAYIFALLVFLTQIYGSYKSSFWAFSIPVYFLIVFVTGPKFFVSKEKKWHKIEIIEIVLGVISIGIIYYLPTVDIIVLFYALISIPHIIGFIYVQNKFRSSIS